MNDIKSHIGIDEVCKRKDYYVSTFSEGNLILRDILNYSIEKYLIDRSIAPFECCIGHDSIRDTFVMFNIKYGQNKYIHSIINAINYIPGALYMLGQEKANNTINLTTRMEFFNREYADDFLKHIRDGLINCDSVTDKLPEVINMIKLIENVDLKNYQLIIQKMTHKEYVVSLIKTKDEFLVNRHPEIDQTLSLNSIINLKEESFSENGIQKVKCMH
jgi:hypothetical protein